MLQRGQFKDELFAVGRWFERVGRGDGEIEMSKSKGDEEARSGIRRAREMAREMEMREGEEVVGQEKKKKAKKKRELMKEALIRKAEKIRKENKVRKEDAMRDLGMKEGESDIAEGIEGKGEKMLLQEAEEEDDDGEEYDHNKYRKVRQTAGHGVRIGKQKVLSLKSEWLKKAKEVNEAYWEPFGDQIVPLEKVTRIPNSEGEGKDSVTFERFEAPLFVFLAWNKRKLQDPGTYQPNIDLYLAQYSLNDLPKPLREDLPTPNLIDKGGQGVQSSSLWMGVPPTDTPLHKDPNPNFFVQLAGHKKIRMISPEDGDLVYSTIRNIVAEETGASPFAGDFQNGTFAGLGAKMRGDEMMNGLEKKLMDSLVWGDDHGVWSWKTDFRLAKWYKTGRGTFEFDPEGNARDTSEGADSKEEAGIAEESNASEEANANVEANTSIEQRPPTEKGDNKRTTLFKGFEAVLGPGDGCYIPMGWWHSLRGVPEEPLGINASVNWWFRSGKPRKAIQERRRQLYKENTSLNAEERDKLRRRIEDEEWEDPLSEEGWDASSRGMQRQQRPHRYDRSQGSREPKRNIRDVARKEWVDQPWDDSGRGTNKRGDPHWKPAFLSQQGESERQKLQSDSKHLIKNHESTEERDTSFPDLSMDGDLKHSQGGSMIRKVGTKDTEGTLSYQERITKRFLTPGQNEQTGGEKKTYWADVVEGEGGGESPTVPVRKHGVVRDDLKYRLFGVGEQRAGEGILPIRKYIAR